MIILQKPEEERGRERREIVVELRDIHGVHKVSLQFQQFITKANEKADKWKLLQKETYIFKFFFASFNTPLYGHQ
jgi:hypothetical protein